MIMINRGLKVKEPIKHNKQSEPIQTWAQIAWAVDNYNYLRQESECGYPKALVKNKNGV